MFWSGFDVWLQNLLGPEQHYSLVHPRILLAGIKVTRWIQPEFILRNPTILCTFENYNRGQNNPGRSDTDSDCRALGIVSGFAYVNCLASNKFQCFGGLHREVHRRLIHIDDEVLITVRPDDLLFHL